MSNGNPGLQVLLVEDEEEDLKQYERDFPVVFSSYPVEAVIHPCGNFGEAFALTSNPLHRYDLIISDTYRGPTQNRDAQVMQMVHNYRGNRFCPLVIYSSGVKPVDLRETAFVVWADKAKPGDIERAIKQVLDTHIPQIARKLHDELERSASSYLWEFLEERWPALHEDQAFDALVLERLVRRRAAMQMSRLNPAADGLEEVQFVEGCEYYIYPRIAGAVRLGEILQSHADSSFRIVLTPHCHLQVQPNAAAPRADYVVAIRAFPACETITRVYTSADGTPRNPWKGDEAERMATLRRRIQSPADCMGQPAGRFWYLPGFLEIPDLYCDCLQVESVPYRQIVDHDQYLRIAVLDTPFAEALQSCFVRFLSAVGLPNLRPEQCRRLMQVAQEDDN